MYFNWWSLGIFVVGWMLGTSIPSDAAVYLSQEDALRQVFPGMVIERKVIFLTDEQRTRVENAARAKVDRSIVPYYIAREKNQTIGYAFFDTHIVRTMPETIMIAIGPDGSVRTVELLTFFEPEEYKPQPKWLAMFTNRVLDDTLWLKRGIVSMNGATLTAWGAMKSVRRALAVFDLVVKKEE